MALTLEEVRYIARLARLDLTAEEETRMAEQMGQVLDYMEKLNSLDTTGVEPMSHVLDLTNVVRDDEAQQRMSHEEALRNAPDTDGVYFRVPKVIE